MRWRKLDRKRWALKGLRIVEKAWDVYEVYVAQLELDLNQAPIMSKAACFKTLKSAKEWGRRKVNQ